MKHLDDKAVLAGLKGQLGRERECVAEFLRYLAEVDARRLYADEGFPSLFAYCVEGLGLSEAETFNRTVVARLLRRVPEVYALLRDGRMTLTAARMIAPHLDEANAAEILTRAQGKSTREVEKLGAELEAKRRPSIGHASQRELLAAGPQDSARPETKAKPDKTRFVTADLVEIRYSAKEAHLKKLERIEALLRSRGVLGSLEEVLDKVFDDYLERHDPAQKVAKAKVSKKPAAKRSVQFAVRPSRYISQAVARQVWTRADCRCEHQTADGRRCGATVGLEIDHIQPFSLGGSSTDPENLRLLCRAHNRLAAEKTFGRAFVAARIQSREGIAGPRPGI